MKKKSKGLTYMQELMLECIKKYYNDNLESPTLKELCDMAGLYAKSTVHNHLKELEQKGYISIKKKKKRGINIIKHC